jgi:arabinofuranosyltransferase
MNIPASKNIYFPIAMLAAAVMLIGTSWIGDDAFITLRVIDNFVNGFGLRYNVIERVQVFTHPLWLIFLTPFYSLTREAMVTTMLVSMMLSLGALWLMATKIARNVEYGSLLVLASVASGSLCNFSTSGLESPLSYLLLALFVWQLFSSEKRWIPASIAGLIFLNRLDLVVLVGPALAHLLFQSQGNERAKVALVAIFPTLAWMIFSIIYYGAPFPNTAYAKLGTGFSTGMLILRGLEYTKDFVLNDPLLALIIGKAVFDAWRSRNLLPMLLALGIALYIAYIIVIGGDFMSGRFFAPPGFLAVCLLARAPVPQLFTEKAKMFALISVVGIVVVLLIMRVTELPSTPIPSNSIGDERLFYYSDNGLIPVLKEWVETGYEPVHRWGKWGMKLKAEAQRTGMPVVALEGNTGMTGYYAGTALHNVDEFALTDAFLARLPAIPGARVGHYQRFIPPGYAETAPNTFPTTSVIALRPLLNDVTLATRAPLFADGRWAAIWRLLSGHYSWVYDANISGVGK